MFQITSPRASSFLHRLPFGLFFFLFLVQVAAQSKAEKGDILIGTELAQGFDMGVDSSEKQRDWLSSEPDYMKMSFPGYQKWAALFITVGEPVDKDRPWMDFSAFKTLTIEMRGAVGGEVVQIGIKTNTQADNGRETKVSLKLSPAWKDYPIPLASFKPTEVSHLYVVTEFVYNGPTPQTIYFRNIRYSK